MEEFAAFEGARSQLFSHVRRHPGLDPGSRFFFFSNPPDPPISKAAGSRIESGMTS
ncbi:hypothetical protein SLG_09540 [Sphingobium sp. SYK-6]|nr:hypothetical protein SLG_09540 [Sphingobium sp. SYK-6]